MAVDWLGRLPFAIKLGNAEDDRLDLMELVGRMRALVTLGRQQVIPWTRQGL